MNKINTFAWLQIVQLNEFNIGLNFHTATRKSIEIIIWLLRQKTLIFDIFILFKFHDNLWGGDLRTKIIISLIFIFY